MVRNGLNSFASIQIVARDYRGNAAVYWVPLRQKGVPAFGNGSNRRVLLGLGVLGKAHAGYRPLGNGRYT